jgi:hypothetical protein
MTEQAALWAKGDDWKKEKMVHVIRHMCGNYPWYHFNGSTFHGQAIANDSWRSLWHVMSRFLFVQSMARLLTGVFGARISTIDGTDQRG